MGLALSAESQSLWNTIHREAVAVAAADPVLSARMHEAIINHGDLASALAQLIASVPSGYTAVGVPARLIGRASDARPALIMDQSLP